MRHSKSAWALAIASLAIIAAFILRGFHGATVKPPQNAVQVKMRSNYVVPPEATTSKPVDSPPRSLGSRASPPPADNEASFPDRSYWQSVPSQKGNPTRLYVVRVIDSGSRKPIPHAKVWVEIGDSGDKRNGYTDDRGAFRFSWRLSSPETHITAEAPGYTTVEDYHILIEDRIIQLTKTK